MREFCRCGLARKVHPIAAISNRKPPLFPYYAQFWFETLRAFGAAGFGGSEFGEVLATAARITPGTQWARLATRTNESYRGGPR